MVESGSEFYLESEKPVSAVLDKGPTLRRFLEDFRPQAAGDPRYRWSDLCSLPCWRAFLPRGSTLPSSVIELQKMSASSPSLDSLMGGDTADASDATALNVDLQTQSDNPPNPMPLRCGSSRRWILKHNPDFKPHFSPIGWVGGLLSAERSF